MSDDTATKIAGLLQQVGDVHHQVFADTDGSDEGTVGSLARVVRATPHCKVRMIA